MTKRFRLGWVFRAISHPDSLGWNCPRCKECNPLHHGLIKCDGCDFPLDQFRVREALAVRRQRLAAAPSRLNYRTAVTVLLADMEV
jgi:hypothetical protein